MPRDEALEWLLANDPQALTTSRRAYGSASGILTSQQDADIAANEISFSDLSGAQARTAGIDTEAEE